jgi:hypothetical protein
MSVYFTGSDLLYEDDYIELLSDFILKHSNPGCEAIIVDPGPGRKNKLAKRMVKLGYTSSFSKPENTDYLGSDFKGHILKFVRTNQPLSADV